MAIGVVSLLSVASAADEQSGVRHRCISPAVFVEINGFIETEFATMGSNSGWPLFFSTVLVCVLILLTVGTWNNHQPLKQLALWFNDGEKPSEKNELDELVDVNDQPNVFIYEPASIYRQAKSQKSKKAEVATAVIKKTRQPLKRRHSIPAPIAIIPDLDLPAVLNSPVRTSEENEQGDNIVEAGKSQKASRTGIPAKNAVYQKNQPVEIIQGPSQDISNKNEQVKTFGKKLQVAPEERLNADAPNKFNAWPKSHKLAQQFDAIIFEPSLSDWKNSVNTTLSQLQGLNSISDPAAGFLLSQFDDQAAFLLHHIKAIEKSKYELSSQRLNYIVQLKHLQYQMDKRAQLWGSVHQLSLVGINQPSSLKKLAAKANASKLSISTKQFADDKGWAEYLLLDLAIKQFSTSQTDDPRATRLAQHMLLRLYSPIMNDQQWNYAHELIDEQFKNELKIIAAEPIDLEQLVHGIEMLEAQPGDTTRKQIARIYQQLIWSESKFAIKVAHAIETHYRNANFRVACESSMLNILLGGRAQVNLQGNKFGSMPNGLGWTLKLNNGQHALASSNAAGNGSALAVRLEKHIFSQTPERAVGRNTVYRSLGELFNSIPSMNVVKSRYASSSTAIESAQSTSSSTAIADQFHVAIHDHLSGPLASIGLEPQAIDLQSSSERIMLRGRIAGSDQLAAYTARPRAINNCVASLQIHESFINNLVEKSIRPGQIETVAQLKSNLNRIVGLEIFDIYNTEFDAANCRLGLEDAIRFSIDDNEIHVRMNLMHHRDQFAVDVYYRVALIDGQIMLTQMPHKTTVVVNSIDRESQLRFQMIGNLFSKKISIGAPPRLQIASPKNLRIGQLVVNEGWVGISWINADKIAMDQPVLRR